MLALNISYSRISTVYHLTWIYLDLTMVKVLKQTLNQMEQFGIKVVEIDLIIKNFSVLKRGKPEINQNLNIAQLGPDEVALIQWLEQVIAFSAIKMIHMKNYIRFRLIS